MIIDRFLRFTLKEELIYEGTLEELKYKIDTEPKKFRIEWLNTNTLKCKAKWSLGTSRSLIFNNIFDGIKAKAVIQSRGSISKVLVTTKLRPEFYLLGIMLVLFLGIYTFDDSFSETFSEQMFYIFPLAFIWLFILFRVQEVILFNKIRKFITKDNKQSSPLITYNK